ncbi:MAG: hypothetical protein EXR66_01230 [Dehalococcoidia bacterium]|nr:hypothetical protein [Dehalococcoidia bacterium]
MTSPDLAVAVIEAFSSAPRPAADNIAPHACDECVAVASYLECRDPFGFDGEALRGCVWDLPLLSAEGKRFYLPAWLLASIRDPRGTDATDALVYALDGDHRWEPEGGYSEALRAVIVRYLESMIEYLDDETGFLWPFLQRPLERWADWPQPLV